MPKVHSAADLNRVVEAYHEYAPPGTSIEIVASIESARALWHVGDIAAWQPQTSRSDVTLQLRALLVRYTSLPYDTIQRSPSSLRRIVSP
jgi:citrate lyase subunit beta-like protein